MSERTLVILNTLSLLAVIIINAFAGAGEINEQGLGEVSRKYQTMITPAGYTFSIWSVIYLALIAHVVFQWYALLKHNFQEVIRQTGIYFIVANLANIAWIFLWVNELVGLSVLVMLVLLWSLIKLTIRLKLEIWDAPVRIIMFVWWPFAIYLGWIIVATVTNVAAFLVSLGWNGAPLSPEIWTIIMIFVATGIYAYLIFSRNLRESAVVGIWAFVGIANKEGDAISTAAYIACAILLLIILYKGYQNREYNPFLKLKRGEF